MRCEKKVVKVAGITGDPGAGALDARGIQEYATQVGKLADAVSKDSELTERIMSAVHANQPEEVEKMFSALGVDAQVSIAEGGGEGEAGGGIEAQARSTTTYTVTIGIGPVHVSVTVTKTRDTK